MTFGLSQDRKTVNKYPNNSPVQDFEWANSVRHAEQTRSKSDEIQDAANALKRIVAGPVRVMQGCPSFVGGPTLQYEVWINIDPVVKNPLKDIRDLKAKYLPNAAIYELPDPTVGGVFTPALPCYEQNREIAKSLGLLP